MKRFCIRTVCSLLLALLLCGTVSASEPTGWSSVREETAVIYLRGMEDDTFSCQIGNTEADIESVIQLSELEMPIETVILIDNSLSIQGDQRKLINELLNDLIANRLTGEQYTIAVISDQIEYLCSGESDYASLKALIDDFEYVSHRTQLTDGLYSVLDGFKSADDGTLRRLLIIADGVDHKQVGYTRDELTDLIKEIGYPIYTVGCSNYSQYSTEELQNFFALSRLTSGDSYYLPDTEDIMDIVSGVTSWNSSVQLTVALPTEACDGTSKVLRIKGETGSDSYTTEIKMPLAEPQEYVEPTPTPTPTPTMIPTPEPTPTPEPKGKSAFPIIALLAAVVIAGAVIAAVLLIKKKKSSERIEEAPEAQPPEVDLEATEMLSFSSRDIEKTESIWSQRAGSKLVLQDLDMPIRRIEVALDGEVLVGRDGSVCQVVLTEPSVARKQCRIFKQSSWVMVANLSHSNVTMLNGKEVAEECELTNGSILEMGRIRMRVQIL